MKIRNTCAVIGVSFALTGCQTATDFAPVTGLSQSVISAPQYRPLSDLPRQDYMSYSDFSIWYFAFATAFIAAGMAHPGHFQK